MTETLFVIDDIAVTTGQALMAAAVLALLALIVLAVLQARAVRERREEAAAAAMRAREFEERMAALALTQAETMGGLRAMNETLTGRQAELARFVSDSLASASHRLNQSLTSTTQQTMDRLQNLHERLAVIDNAQKNLTELSSQVTSLKEILANKQTRGAFGQGRMEAIIRDALPTDAYAFQFTLSNRTRPDCAVFLADDGRPLIIDAKFPLEAFTAFRDGTTDEARKQAAQRVRQDVLKHVNDIAARYLLPGETQDLALMFVPSESVYADLHDGFDDIIQKAYRAQVLLVSPTLLVLAIQVIQHIRRDAKMREAAHQIRTEVGHLMDDLGRLHDRVLKLQQHFGKANEDVAQILVSTDKITKRGGRIEALEFDGEDTSRATPLVLPSPLGRKIDAAE
ncbi:MAG TPA: DNA recombination protein RmuC [Xanthobacteraceae bacterium]|nr:DNA recombination protein RmuC [Xanthobacteraceae bacterium]